MSADSTGDRDPDTGDRHTMAYSRSISAEHREHNDEQVLVAGATEHLRVAVVADRDARSIDVDRELDQVRDWAKPAVTDAPQPTDDEGGSQ